VKIGSEIVTGIEIEKRIEIWTGIGTGTEIGWTEIEIGTGIVAENGTVTETEIEIENGVTETVSGLDARLLHRARNGTLGTGSVCLIWNMML